MSETRSLRKQSIPSLLEKLEQNGQRIIAPQPAGPSGTPWFTDLDRERHIDLEQMTAVSPKSGLFPVVEEILRFRKDGKQVVIEGDKVKVQPTVLFGLRPCDARGLRILESIFQEGEPDVFLRERRAATTVVAFSCTAADPDCFCTSVGGGPGDTEGSDLLLSAIDDDHFLVEIVTPKGKELVELGAGLFEPAKESEQTKVLAAVPVRFPIADVLTKLPALFNLESFWQEQSLACLGCSTCAFVCPICSCFDLEDEADLKCGSRLRCWDSCGQRLFTLHASGHNPRSVQSQRWRQRVMHKFSYLPERGRKARGSAPAEGSTSLLGCVGCGRCSRSCPVDMNLIERLTAIAESDL